MSTDLLLTYSIVVNIALFFIAMVVPKSLRKIFLFVWTINLIMGVIFLVVVMRPFL